MNPLTSRLVTIASAGLLIFELIQGNNLVILNNFNFVDSIIIIIAFTGLLLGICIPETQTSDSASPNDAISSTETAISATTTTQAENSEDGKSEG